MDNEKHKALIAAADFFNQTSRKMLTNEGRLHAETLIASTARMAGSLMYRSFGFDNKKIEPGTAVLSDQANVHGPKLMNMMFATLQQLGHQVGEGNLNREFLSSQFSQLSFKESLDRLAPFFLKYCEVAPMSFSDAAFGAAIATGILVHDCREVIPVEKGGAIAVYGFVEGTKTVPPPVVAQAAPQPSPPEAPTKKKPWYKAW
jgi:hypothetical protein